jgi:LacI family transcriptional regulator
MSQKVSIKSIAQQIGVSNATVSLVLNGKEKEGRVSKDMADKIRHLAKELNYKPNNLARGLRVGRSQTIGLIVADISNLFFANLAFHIQEHAEKFGYTVLIGNTNESETKSRSIINSFIGRQVDGLIIVPTEDGEDNIKVLLDSKQPIVLLDRWFPDLQASHVIVDNFQASKKAVEYLINEKCKKIAFVVYNSNLPHMRERKRGYVKAMEQAGIYNPELIKEVNYDNLKEDIDTSMTELLDKNNRVDAVFFATNSISMIGIRKILDLKLRIPKDIRVVCFDKNDFFDFTDIPIPYIQQPIEDMGRKAVEVLIEQIESKNFAPSKIEMFTKLSNEV